MGEISWPILISILHRWVQYLGCGQDRPLGSQNGPSAIGPQLFGSSTVVWYVMCIDFLNGTLWVRFHGWYWYQSFMDGSNIWSVDRADPWGPEMDHPPLGRSYLVEVPSYHMSCAFILLTWLDGWYSTADIDINRSSIGPIFGLWKDRPLGSRNGLPSLGRSYLVEVLSYDMSCALISLTGLYG